MQYGRATPKFDGYHRYDELPKGGSKSAQHLRFAKSQPLAKQPEAPISNGGAWIWEMGPHSLAAPKSREQLETWKWWGNDGENRPPIDLALGRCVVRRSSPQWLKSSELYGVNDGNFVHIIAHPYFTWACLKNKATSFHPLVKHHCPQWPTLTRSNAPKFNRLLIYMPVSQIPLGVWWPCEIQAAIDWSRACWYFLKISQIFPLQKQTLAPHHCNGSLAPDEHWQHVTMLGDAAMCAH